MFSRKSTTRTGRDSLNCRRVGIKWPIIIIMTLCPYKNTDYFHFKDEQLQLMETPTCRDTRGRSRGRSRDPDRWPLLWTGTAHTVASPTGRRPQLHYGTSGGREGETERHNKTHKQTNREQGGEVDVNLKIQTEESSVSVSWQLDLSDSVCVFHFYSLLVVVLYTKPGCAQSFAPYLNKYIFLHLLFGVYLRHWYLKRSSEVCLPASRLQPLNELHSVDCCCSDGWISLRNEKKVLNKWNKE